MKHLRPHVHGRRPRSRPANGSSRCAGCLFTSDLSVKRVPCSSATPASTRSGFSSSAASIYHIRHPDRRLEAEPGDGGPVPGHVRGPRAGHDPDGGGGRPARGRRDRRRPPRHRPLRVGREHRRVHRHRHGGEAPGGGSCTGRRTGARLHQRPLGQDFWTLLNTGGTRPGGHGDGELRLPRRPPGDGSRR